MPDASDVAQALVATIAGALYPIGTAQPSILGKTVRIYRGWPAAKSLETDLAAGNVNVSVFERPNMSRDETRFPAEWQATAIPSSLTVALAGTTATFAGTCALGQAAGVVVGRTVYPYRVAAGDTPQTVAAAIGQQIAGATVAGASVTAPGLTNAETGMDSLASREVRRQSQGYQISIWAEDPATRDAAATAVDGVLAGLTNADDVVRPFLLTPDGSQVGPVKYAGTASVDKGQDANFYVRHLFYSVEYPTVQTQTQPVMLFGGLILERGFGDVMTYPDGTPVADGATMRETGDDFVVRGIVNVAVDEGETFTMDDGAPITLTADGA